GEHVPALAFLIKLGMTALTLGVGFKGGEVTPLFVIGATLGASLAGPLDMPVDLLAAAGFVSVFAAAANTPIACIAMSVELFGGDGILLFSIAIVVAYLASGHRGIYGSQRLARSKHGARLAEGIVTLRDVSRHSRGTSDRPRW
ncbi:MAG: chloride channel protein, partial [Thermomicrobiales bacterium]|nr:chloride channel protein [Thermomicrobiales bacterium]